MASGGERVLVADPDILFSGRLRAMLVSEGCQVECVSGITEAVKRLGDSPFRCAVVDEALPEMKGYDAVPIIRAIVPGIPVIMTATHNSAELESRVRKNDVFFYHCKSFDMYELVLAVKNAIRKRCVPGKEGKV